MRYLLHEKLEKRLTKMGAPDLRATCASAARRCACTSPTSRGCSAERDWLAGRRLSLADFAAAAHISVLDYFGDIPWRDIPGRQDLVHEAQVAAVLPAAAGRPLAGPGPGGHYDDLDF